MISWGQPRLSLGANSLPSVDAGDIGEGERLPFSADIAAVALGIRAWQYADHGIIYKTISTSIPKG